MLLAPVAAVALASQSPRALAITRDVHIDAATADLNVIFGVTLSPWGDFLLADSRDQNIRVFNASGMKPSIGRKGAGPGEFANVTRTGFIGDTLWTLDPSNNRITFFAGPAYKYKRTVREPHSMPVANGVDPETELFVQAVTRSGDLRAAAGAHTNPAHRPEWAVGVDSGAQILLGIAVNGSFRNRVTIVPHNTCVVFFPVGNSRGGIHIPFCPERVGSDWDGSSDVLSAGTESISAGTWRVRVTLTGEDGSPIFTRTISAAAVTIPKQVRDSTIAERTASWQKNGPAWVAAMPHIVIPTIYPPVRAVLLGQDGACWLDIRTNSDAHTWYLLDRKGMTIGTVTVPANVTLRAVNGSVAWGTESDADGLEGVVRYAVKVR